MRRAVPLLLVLSGLAVAAPASAATTSRTAAPAKQVTNPDWLRKPSADDISRYYPKPARDHNIGGRARVECRLASDGVLSNCVVLSEAPAGYGFGEAALNVATRFQMRPGTRNGQPIGGQIIVPILFSPEPLARTSLTGPAAPGALAHRTFLLFFAALIGWPIVF